MTKHKIIRECALPLASLWLLALITGACNAQLAPTINSEQASREVLEQDMASTPVVSASEQHSPPTPEFDTTEIEPDGPILPDSSKPIKQNDCPDLDSMLFQIAQASDPLDLAKQLQLKVKEDKIQVLLILDGEDTSFLQNFGVEMGTQVGPQVQAFAPINRLCDLANAEEVLAIRLPGQAMPQ